MVKVTYIFSGGRKEKFNSNDIQAKEHYYGLPYISQKNINLEIIEFNEKVSSFSFVFRLFDKVMNKFLSLPFYTARVSTLSNIKKILNSNYVVIVNESAGCSLFFLLIIAKYFSRANVSIFIMGLYSKSLRFPSLKYFHNLVIKILIFFIDNVFFLGKGELEKAKKLHRKDEKLIHFPFCVDTNFWLSNEENKFLDNKNILFVGNDGNRNFNLLVNIAEKMNKYNFIFVSNNEIVLNTKLKNVKVINGSWDSREIEDSDLREIYKSSRLSIIPLKESSQPSGQSVALQSMSLGIPVIISKTKGFWDNDVFIDNQDLILVSENSTEGWINKIEENFHQDKKLKLLVKNSKEKIKEQFNLEVFNKNLDKYIKV